MNYIERYFDKPVFAGFAPLLPSTFVLLSIFMSAAGSDFMISEISDIKRTLNLFTAAYFILNISLFIFWIALIIAGVLKADWQMHSPEIPFAEMMRRLRPAFIVFFVAGIGVATGFLMIIFKIIKHHRLTK